jgi:hypothetical protein
VEHEEYAAIETEGLAAMEQSPENAGYSPRNYAMTGERESLSQLLECTTPDRLTIDNHEHRIEDEACSGSEA